jgi:uncharacterized protein (TIGR03435 family)
MRCFRCKCSALFIVILFNLMGITIGYGQSTAASPIRFDSASIKRNTSISNGIGNRFGPELFSWTNVPLKAFIEQIYGLKDYQIIGAPDWADTEKWDIVARTDVATTMQQKNEMAKTLLAERFGLNSHMQTRELPVYRLTALKGGPEFQQPKDDDTPAGIRPGTGVLVAHKWDVSTLPFWLSLQLNTPVIDTVGLKGVFDFELKWAPVPNEGNFSTRNDTNTVPADPSGPTIFTAIQDQLNLKIESGKGPVQVLIIDSVTRPSEN